MKDKRRLVINAKRKLIRKAFHWKAEEKVTSQEIIRRLKGTGMMVFFQKMSWILRNPFYCGLMAHNLLGDEIVKGRHELLISKELFLEVNGLLAANRQGYKIDLENDHYSLKRFLKCGECGQFLRALKHKGIYHNYQCNTVGCSCSRRVEDVHIQFWEFIGQYTLKVDEDMRYVIREQIATYNQLNAEGEQMRDSLTSQINVLHQKLDWLEERLILEEIKPELYAKYDQEFREEKAELEDRLAEFGDKVSNLEDAIDLVLEFSTKLATA